MGPGGVVAAVAPGSPADRAGVRAGDVVLSLNGHQVLDVLDWQWFTAEDEFEVAVARRPEHPDAAPGGPTRLAVTRAPDEPFGIEFETALFDGVHTCHNTCTFCFVRQLPDGLRPSLYVRDDDFRLSFLSGNFITLTNLSDGETARIVDQRLSPLYVSLHAVDPGVRRRLVCAIGEDRALERLDALLAGGIDVHVQIVLVPGVNDGAILQGTLEYLSRREHVLSVGVVPLGYTRHQARFARSYEDPNDAAGVLGVLEPWRALMTGQRGVRWVYGADELYLNAGAGIPTAEEYDGFPQYENGIGLLRSFADEWQEEIAAGLRPPQGPVTVVTGELFADMMYGALGHAGLSESVDVLPVTNYFFGGSVSVTGLLTGADIVEAVREEPDGAVYLVPDVVLNDDGVTLDDVPGGELAARTGRNVRVVSCNAAGLARAIRELSPRP